MIILANDATVFFDAMFPQRDAHVRAWRKHKHLVQLTADYTARSAAVTLHLEQQRQQFQGLKRASVGATQRSN